MLRLQTFTSFVTLLLALLLLLGACSEDELTPSEGDYPEGEEPWHSDPTSNVTRSGLPTMRINTPDGKDIESKDKYVMKCEVLLTRENGKRDLYGLAAVRGRGNSTWGGLKKPYAVHFHSEQSVLGRAEDNNWVLLANYFDSTLIRNDVAFYMGREMSLLDFTPDPAMVYLHLNGAYRGIYQICEKISLAPDRVRTGPGGFLLEIDSKAGPNEVTFPTKYLKSAVCINIKEPEEIVIGDENYEYIKNYVSAFEDALFSDSFMDEEEGYRKYIDEDSFVEWYLVNEISKNCDAKLWTSCYMNLRRGDKLKMGPLWDFDAAFAGTWDAEKSAGEEFADPTGFYIKNASWYLRLFESPTFVAKVKSRFADYFRDRQMIYDRIDTTAKKVKPLIYNENLLYGRVCDQTSSKREVEEQYQTLIDRLKEWIETRMQWLNENINAL